MDSPDYIEPTKKGILIWVGFISPIGLLYFLLQPIAEWTLGNIGSPYGLEKNDIIFTIYNWVFFIWFSLFSVS